MNNLIDEFLLVYATDNEWPERGWEAISRRICCERYSPKNGREFIMIAYGWMWGKSGSQVEGNCYAALLQLELDKVYKVVAAENHWPEE